MQTKSNIPFLCFLFMIGSFMSSCVHDDDYAVPEVQGDEPVVTVNTTIVSIKKMYRGYEPVKVETGPDSKEPMYIEAYVISSDESGNFYKSLIVQDAPESSKAGISISTDVTDLYTKYNPGRKIYFRVDGLYIGQYAGLPTLGILNGNEVGRIAREDFESRIKRSLETFVLIPNVISVAEANDKDRLNTLIKFEEVQFPEGLAGIEHFGNPTNNYGVNRLVEDCDKNTIFLRTNGYADFKNLVLPKGKGSLTGILSIFNNDFQVFIRDISDVQMMGDRCDP